MAVKIESAKLVSGGTFRFVRKGFAMGKQAFAKEGYAQAKNTKYMQKGNTIVHYNSIMKLWIVEKF